ALEYALAVRLERIARAQDAAYGYSHVRGNASYGALRHTDGSRRVSRHDCQRERASHASPQQRARFFKDRTGPKDLPSRVAFARGRCPIGGKDHALSALAAWLRFAR